MFHGGSGSSKKEITEAIEKSWIVERINGEIMTDYKALKLTFDHFCKVLPMVDKRTLVNSRICVASMSLDRLESRQHRNNVT